MLVKDNETFEIIEKLKNLYNNIIHNQIIRKKLLEASISKNTWVDIDELFDNNHVNQINGYDLERLYSQIISLVSFLDKLKNDVVVSIKNTPARYIESMEPRNKMLFKMTLGAIDYNVNAFADLVTNLFHSATAADKKAHGRDKAIYRSFPQLKEIGKSLIT
jgi:hypothetical protein